MLYIIWLKKEISLKMAKIKVKTLSDELYSILSENPETLAKIERRPAWPIVAGPQLSAITELVSTTDGVMKIFTDSASAKSLLTMRKAVIISEFNKMFPDAKIKRLQIVKRT